MAKSPRRVHDAHFNRTAEADQSGTRSTQGSQDPRSTQQRIRHPRSTDYRLEATGTRRDTHPLRVRFFQASAYHRATRTDRIASFSADRPVKGGERLAEKKITDELTVDPRKLIDPADRQFSINQQCRMLDLSRSSYYYQPVGESVQNLALMERIDRLYTARPEMGVRRMHQELTTPDTPVNIKKVRRLMRLMGLEAVGRHRPPCQAQALQTPAGPYDLPVPAQGRGY